VVIGPTVPAKLDDGRLSGNTIIEDGTDVDFVAHSARPSSFQDGSRSTADTS
jgi:hypothetical protein